MTSGIFATEQINLQWKHFGPTVSASFQKLRNAGDLFDVTLACSNADTGRATFIKAHKVVLAASSAVLKDLLVNMDDTSRGGMLYLSGIEEDYVKSVVDFVYSGEVNVERSNLERFLQVAEQLKVEGLVREDNNVDPEPAKVAIPPPPPPSNKRSRVEYQAEKVKNATTNNRKNVNNNNAADKQDIKMEMQEEEVEQLIPDEDVDLEDHEGQIQEQGNANQDEQNQEAEEDVGRHVEESRAKRVKVTADLPTRGRNYLLFSFNVHCSPIKRSNVHFQSNLPVQKT